MKLRETRCEKIALTTLGCKANWADTEAISQALARTGFEIVPFDSPADAYVVNTCTVTAVANAQSRQMLRRARRGSPNALIVATGCYGEVDRDEIAAIPGVDAVFGSKDREALIAYLCGKIDHPPLDPLPSREGRRGEGAVGPVPISRQSRARAFLKIQDGCNRRCAYCIVPRARGRSRSMPFDDVLAACTQLSRDHREILLAGIDIGQYGRDLPGRPSLSKLVSRLAAAQGMARLRISSLDPSQIDERLIELIALEIKICRHVHLSIQSGSDAVLRSMARGYRARDISRVASELAARVPGIAITGDVIAGFPCETDAMHRETADLLESLPIAGLHVFPFSVRDGTRAASMPDQVAAGVKKSRAAELRGIARRARKKFLEGLIGEAFDVILTSSDTEADGTVLAVADNAVKIKLPPGGAAYGGMARAILTEVRDLEAYGKWE